MLETLRIHIYLHLMRLRLLQKHLLLLTDLLRSKIVEILLRVWSQIHVRIEVVLLLILREHLLRLQHILHLKVLHSAQIILSIQLVLHKMVVCSCTSQNWVEHVRVIVPQETLRLAGRILKSLVDKWLLFLQH